MNKDLDLKSIEDFRTLIFESKSRAKEYINSEISWLYFHIGQQMQEILLMKRNEISEKELLDKLSKQLTLKYGSGWSPQQLRHCLHFYKTFKDYEYLNEMISSLNWSSGKLKNNIDSLLYQRSQNNLNLFKSNQKDFTVQSQSDFSLDNKRFDNSYILDYLGFLNNKNNLRTALINDLEQMIKELGDDFYFAGKQYKLQIDREDYYIDLLFYHYKLKLHIAIDLKPGKFKVQDKEQMELCLQWLDRNKMLEGNNPPIGFILNIDYQTDHLELMSLNNTQNTENVLKHPDIIALEKKLKERIKLSRERYELEHSEEN